MLDTTDHLVAIIGGALGVVALVGGAWLKWGRPKAQQAEAGWSAILGRPEVKDRSGAVIQPSQPGMVAQVAILTDTVRELVDMNHRVDQVEAEVVEVKHRVAVLEDARVERVASQVESAQMWGAVRAVNESQPGD